MKRSDPGEGRGALTLLLRACVGIYWVAVLAFGGSRLMQNGWEALLPVIHLWYLAALAFLVVWAPAVIVASFVTAKGEAKRAPPAKVSEPLRLR